LGDQAGVDPTRPDVLSKLLSSSGKGDLLILFHRNPGLIDTAPGIAKRLGKKADAVTADISELVGASILQKKTVGRYQVFSLDREKDEATKKGIAEYIVRQSSKIASSRGGPP
jgi:hypothetical protein